MITTDNIDFRTEGNGDVINITQEVVHKVTSSGVDDGLATLFSASATSAITTIEYESGCLSDIKRMFNELADPSRVYEHNKRWGDGNGHSHVLAALYGPSFSVPIIKGKLTLGTWQQIVFLDFDNRQRTRKIILQIVGE